MGNIFNHNRLPFNFRLDRSEYWDFFLSQPSYGSDGTGDGLADGCLISYIDTTDPDCVWFDSLYSKADYFWDKAVNNGLSLKNIGYTGVDNGLINYLKDRISNEEFLKLFNDSEFKIEKNDLRLLLNKVYGNNQIFSYSNDIVEEDGSKHPVGKVGQYTTLKDKNGTEIYEGDIIQLDYPSWNYIVFWDDDSLSFQYRKVGSKQAYQLAMTELQLRQYEVVGNIYDNPELLKDDVQ